MRSKNADTGGETLKLTDWEVANLHLPPITTMTLYEGTASVEFLRERLVSILEANPWLTSRIVKKETRDGVVALAFAKNADARRAADQQFTISEPGVVGLSLSMPYEGIVRCLLPVQ